MQLSANQSSSDTYVNDTVFTECSTEELKSFFGSNHITNHDIKDYYYFKKFDMESEYNKIGTCSLVSLANMLIYYDTYYNDTIVEDTITYTNRFNNIITIDTMKNGEFSNSIDFRYSDATLGPSKEFHDYLLDLGIKKEIIELVPEYDVNGNPVYVNGDIKYVVSSISNSEMNEIFEEYCSENDVDISLLTYNYDVLFTGINMLNLLDNNIPLIVSIEDYKYFYGKNGVPIGKNTSNTKHSIIVYGYIETDNGTYLKADFGYNDDYVYYVNINYVVKYCYYSFNFENNHVCSSNYVYKNVENENFILSICPCKDLDYYFDHTFVINESSEMIHKFTYKYDSSLYVVSNHEFVTENSLTSSHINKCKYDSYCNLNEEVVHNLYDSDSIKKYGFGLKDGHRFHCDKCDYVYLTEHTIIIDQYSSYYHKIRCLYCDYTNKVEHNSCYTGTISSHYRYCDLCDDVFDDDDHDITYNLHSDNYHEVECLCGFIDYQYHNYDENLSCVNCGFSHSTHSFYKYTKIDTTFHNKICLCGYTIKERHLFKDYNGGLKCTSCGYFTSDYIFINSYLDQIKNTLYIDNNEYTIKKKDGENQ